MAELEARLLGKVPVHVGIAEVYVAVGREALADVVEAVLERCEVHLDAGFLPDLLLVAQGSVRAAADQVAQAEGVAHPVELDMARRAALRFEA